MIYTWKELKQKEGNRYLLESLISKGKYKKISHGLYSDGNSNELEELFARYPKATLTMQSAFEYYELSNYIPEKYYIVTPRNHCVIKNNKVDQSYASDEIINIGRIEDDTKYGHIYVYDLERMLIELFRMKNKLPRDYYLEVISSYRELFKNDAISSYKLSEYCKHFKNGLAILNNIQEVFA